MICMSLENGRDRLMMKHILHSNTVAVRVVCHKQRREFLYLVDDILC
jgi:hypothetical protein